MITLHLGVADIPYSGPAAEGPSTKSKGRGSKGSGGVVTTGEVAEVLEARYGVMGAFFTKKEDVVVGAMRDSLEHSLEAMLLGAPAPTNPFASATSHIETLFKKFLSDREIEGMDIPGVPTQAALDGISSRFAGGRGPRRPSFIDTGLYQSSFKAWVD